MTSRLCANGCQKPGKSRCSRCSAVYYCSRDCQIAHWKAGHKRKCPELKAAKQQRSDETSSKSIVSDPPKKPFSFRALSDYKAGDVIMQSHSSLALSLDQALFAQLCANDARALSEFESKFDRWMEIQSDFSLSAYQFHNGFSSDASSKFSLFRSHCIFGESHCTRMMQLNRVFENGSAKGSSTIAHLFPEFAQVSHDCRKANAWRSVVNVGPSEIEIKLVAMKPIKQNEEIFVDVLTEQAYSDPSVPYLFSDDSRNQALFDRFGISVKSKHSSIVSDESLVSDLAVSSDSTDSLSSSKDHSAKQQRLEDLFAQVFDASKSTVKSDADSEDSEPSFFTLGRAEEAIQLAVSMLGENPLILAPLYAMVVRIVSGNGTAQTQGSDGPADIARTDLMSYLIKYAHFDRLVLSNAEEFTSFLPPIRDLMKSSFADDQRCVDYVMSESQL